MRFFGQLLAAILERVGGAPAQGTAGRVYYRTDINRPQLDDGTTVDQLMLEKHLGEARRSDKVELDDTGLGNEVVGTLPVTKGGSGLSSLAGGAGQALVVNAGETGFEFREVEMIGSDGQTGTNATVGDGAVVTLTAPANAIGVYLQGDENNAFDIRVGWGAGGAPTTTTGIPLLPGVTEFIRTSADLKVIAETGGTNQTVNFTWVIR